MTTKTSVMETVLLLIPLIIVLIIVLTINNKLDQKFNILRNELQDLKQSISKMVKEANLPAEKKEPIPDVIKKFESNFKVMETPFSIPEPVQEQKVIVPERVKELVVIKEPVFRQAALDAAPESSGFFKRNPDMEKFIGENLINKIGIAILVLGISFFVKFAIDQNWINETGRVFIGLLCGGILIVVAHRLSKNYRSFSSVLMGGGLTVFYFTIAFAYHQYHLLSQSTSFSIMIVITVFAVLLSIWYDRIELAILATIGGFITPFLVSNGQGNYIVLFTYLGILNAGLIVLAYAKSWRILNFIGFLFTFIIYSLWLNNEWDTLPFPAKGVFLFATLFYIMFVTMNLIHHVLRGSLFKAFDFIILLSINLFYYAAGMLILEHIDAARYKGLFTASLGLFNLLLTFFFYKKEKIDKNFVYFLIGLTLSYISLTGPVQFKGHFITLFWGTETVLLIWLYQKSGIQLMKLVSLVVSVLMMISLVLDLFTIYNFDSSIPILINKGFITCVFSAIALCCNYFLIKKETAIDFIFELETEIVKIGYLSLSILLLFLSGSLEIIFQFSNHFKGIGLEYLYFQLYFILFFLILFWILAKRGYTINSEVRLIIPCIIILFYLVNTRSIFILEKLLLSTQQDTLYFLAQWLSIIALIFLIIHTIQFAKKNEDLYKNIFQGLTGIVTTVFLLILSIEIYHLYVWITYTGLPSLQYDTNLYDKAGLSIIWGLFSFAIIWIGMKYNIWLLRVMALILFGITIIKLFVYDISNIPVGGKIAAFILLGVLLLTVSFMYQRLKKLILDKEKKN